MNSESNDTGSDDTHAVIVLGMHRSGTSALAGVLNLLGVDMGSGLIAAQEGVNPRGLWERRDVIDIHDRLLNTLGSRWDDLRPLPDRWWQSREVESFKDELLAVVSREFSGVQLWGLKDPRLCRLLPLWRDILESFGTSPTYVLIYRHPQEVAASLVHREVRMSAERACLLWFDHVLNAEHYSRGSSRVFLGYEDLLRDWRDALALISRVTSINWPVPLDSAASGVNAFLDNNLRHQRAQLDGGTVAMTSTWLSATYQALLDANKVSGEELLRIFRDLRQEYLAAQPLMATLIESQAEDLERLGTDYMKTHADYMKTHAILEGEIPKYDKALTESAAKLAEREQQLADTEARLEELTRLAAANGLDLNCDGDSRGEIAPADESRDKVYDAAVDLQVDNNSHTQLFRFIEGHSGGRPSRILEVGCATGFLGAVLREHGHTVWGVEASPRAAAIAKNRLNHVFVGDVDKFFSSQDVKDRHFDYIVFGDILEHLPDPIKILEDCQAVLSSEGAVVASIPNVAHLAVRVMLLEGRWEYADSGILDRTHLRFFTRDNIIDVFERTGFEVLDIECVKLPAPHPFLPAVDSDLLAAASRLTQDNARDVFQYIVLARAQEEPLAGSERRTRAPAQTRRRILGLLPIEDWTIGNLRIRDPLEKLCARNGWEFRIGCVNAFQPEILDWPDTVVFQRESDAHVLSLIYKLQRLGKRIVFDIDDLLTSVPSFLMSADDCLAVRSYLEESLRMADAITVSTDRLKEEMLVYNDQVFSVPNCAHTSFRPTKHSGTGTVSLLLSSADTIRVDFILPALRRLMDDPSLNLRLIGVGPPGRLLQDAGFDVARHDYMPHSQFKAFIASLNDTIGLIPLDDSRFSRCKSAVKFLDYALAGIPVVCSEVPPYSDIVASGSTGVLCDNRENDWYQTVRRLALSNSERMRLSREARTHCLLQFPMRRAANSWLDVLSFTQPGQGQVGSRLLKGLENLAGS